MAMIFRVYSRSQHVEGASRFSLAGPRACSPTSLAFAYRFLRNAQSGGLQMDQEYFQGELSNGIKRGVQINQMFPNKLQRKSAHEVVTYINEENLLHADSPCEIGALSEGEAMRVTADPDMLIEGVVLFLPDALEKLVSTKTGDDKAMIATCAGHTTMICQLKGSYFFINSSSSNPLKAKLEAHDNLDSLTVSLLESWGTDANEIDLTIIALKTDLTLEKVAAYDFSAGLDLSLDSLHPFDDQCRAGSSAGAAAADDGDVMSDTFKNSH